MAAPAVYGYEGVVATLGQLDEILHQKVRLGIMSALIARGEADFRFLKDTLSVTDGNLSIHLSKLEDAGLILSAKEFVRRKPHTTYTPTDAGRATFEAYLRALEQIVQAAGHGEGKSVMLPLRPESSVVWNLFLAVVPVALAFVISWGLRRRKGRARRLFWLLLLPVWLAFLPNTCYLLTEWRHFIETVSTSGALLTDKTSRVRVLDLLTLAGFYVFFSGSGLLCFFLAVWPLDRLARGKMGRGAWICQAAVFFLCGLGVYLGLVNRFNTWDILHPVRSEWLTHAAADTFGRPLVLTLITGFSLTLWLLYTVFDLAMDGAQMRLSRRRRPVPPDLGQHAPQERWRHALK